MELLKELVVTILCNRLVALLYYPCKLTAGKDKSPMGLNNFSNAFLSMLCMIFAIIGGIFFVLLVMHFYLYSISIRKDNYYDI